MLETAPLNRTGIYMRLSRDDDKAGESLSIENQRAIVSDFVLKHGGVVTEEYADDGWSGTNFDRPAVKRLLVDIANGKLDTVVVKDLSRFGRNYIVTGHYIDYVFPAYGVRFIALNDNVDTFDRESAAMDMMPITNVFNEWHSANTSKKIRAVLEANWRQGKFTNWAYPYGYRAGNDPKRTAVIDEEAARVVRRIFKLRAQGESINAIARTLSDEGVPNPRTHFTKLDGGKILTPCSPYWSARTVADILANGVYLGTATLHKTTRFSYKNKMTVKVPENERIVYENSHEPIISRDDWNAVKALKNSVSRGRRDSNGTLRALSGLAVCADCGKKMKLRKTKGSRPSSTGYACRTYTDLGKSYCSSHFIKETLLEKLVSADLRSFLGDALFDGEKARKAFLNGLKKQSACLSDSTEKEIAALKRRLKEVEDIIVRAFEEKVLGKLSEDVFETLCSRYESEKTALNLKLAPKTRRPESDDSAEARAERAAALAQKYCRLEELSREACIALIELISVGEKPLSDDEAREIHIYYKFSEP